MSKSILIRENGTGTVTNLNGVNEIQTSSDLGTVSWIEEDVADKTAAINITRCGTYSAEKDDLYGFTRAIVNIDYTDGTEKQLKDRTYTITLDSHNRPHISVSKVLT